GARLALHPVRQRLDRVAPAERVNDVRDAALLGQYLLRAERHHHRLLARQRQRLVERVGVQRLHAAHDAGPRLHGDAYHVVELLLPGQGAAVRLGVGAETERARIFRPEALPHERRPQTARRPQLRYLLEEVVVQIEEEGEARGEVVDREAARDGRLHVG